LQRKAEHYAGEYGTEIQIFSASVEASIDELSKQSYHAKECYCFLDLDAKKFDAYPLASKIQSVFPAAVCIAFALAPAPPVVQKTKLNGISTLLQRFQFEELLKKICAEIRAASATPTLSPLPSK
jgi:hypothetical protein